MHFDERYIHDLTVANVKKILKTDPWKKQYNQKITSAITNDNDQKEPDQQLMAIDENTAGINAFSDIKFDKHVKRILDVGGGKYDFISHYMQRKTAILVLVLDQFNRSKAHNSSVTKTVLENKVDAATSMSVLNVIMEVEVRLQHINLLKASLKIGGKAYFKIWPGELPLKGSHLPLVTNCYYQANAGAERFLEEVQMIFGLNNAAIDKKIPNLIVAKKSAETPTPQPDIISIQTQSREKLLIFNQKKDKALSNIYSGYTKTFYINFSFFKKMENKFLEANRYSSPKLQHEYDKRNGLVLHNRLSIF